MADNNKYLNILKNTASANWKLVNDAITALQLTQLIMNTDNTHVSLNADDWFAVGQPPAQRDGGRYLVDLRNPKVITYMWSKTLFDVLHLGCYAASDASDAINQINNDNLDGIITDREAVIAMSQINGEAISAFRRMQDNVKQTIEKLKG